MDYTTFIGLRWRLRVVYWRASPLLRPFWQIFGPKFGWVTWPVNGGGGRWWPHIWISWPQLAYSVYNFHWATMTIKGSLQASIPIVKAFLTRNFLPRRNWRKICVFWRGGMGSKCKILFSGPPKGTSLRHTAWFDVLIVKIGAGVLAVGCRKNQKN